MPVNATYPGVYIDELPGGVRTITGVPASIAAFVGTAPRSPADAPMHVATRVEYRRASAGSCPAREFRRTVAKAGPSVSGS